MRSPGVEDPAPDASLRDQHGQTVTLSEVWTTRPLLVVFYPFAFSRVCTGELDGLRDRLEELDGEDRALAAISCDPVFSLRAFADADGLRFPLLSDFWPHGAVASAYGVLDEERGCASRSSFVVDRGGVVRWSVHHAMPDARDLEAHVRALSEAV